MSGYDFKINTKQYMNDVEGAFANTDPDRTFLGILNRELMGATEREKETRAALAEHQAKAEALTREREAIERAINAYQNGPSNRATAVDPCEAGTCSHSPTPHDRDGRAR